MTHHEHNTYYMMAAQIEPILSEVIGELKIIKLDPVGIRREQLTEQ